MLHGSLLLAVVWLLLQTANHAMRGEGCLFPVAGFVIGMGIVLLHELGHAGMARLCGCFTREIVLNGLGGVAIIELPEGRDGRAVRLAIFCAGPAVNVILFLCGYLVFGPPDPHAMQGWSEKNLPGWDSWFALVMVWNVLVLGFNLLPILPLDGGQIVFNALALVMDQAAARFVALLSTVTTGFVVVHLAATRGWWTMAVFVTVTVLLGFLSVCWELAEEPAGTPGVPLSDRG